MDDVLALLRPTSLKILNSLLSGPKTLTDLSEDVGLGKPVLVRHLRDLETAGFVRRSLAPKGATRQAIVELVGGSIHLEFRPAAGIAIRWLSPGPVDHDLPLASQIHDIGTRDTVIRAMRGLRIAVESTSARIWMDSFVILFGSFARGERSWKSDIDVLFVTDERLDEQTLDLFGEVLPDINEALQHKLQVHFTTRSEFLDQKRTIHKEAARDGMVLHDPHGEDELWRKIHRYSSISE